MNATKTPNRIREGARPARVLLPPFPPPDPSWADEFLREPPGWSGTDLLRHEHPLSRVSLEVDRWNT